MSPYNTKWPAPPGQLVQGHAEDCVYRRFPMDLLAHSRSVVHNNEPHLQCLLCKAIITLPIAEAEHELPAPDPRLVAALTAPKLVSMAKRYIDIDLLIEEICNEWAAEQRFAYEHIGVLEHSIWMVLTDELNDNSPFSHPQMDNSAK